MPARQTGQQVVLSTALAIAVVQVLLLLLVLTPAFELRDVALLLVIYPIGAALLTYFRWRRTRDERP